MLILPSLRTIPSMIDSLRAEAAAHLRDVVTQALCYAPPADAVLVFDRRSALASLLTDAYIDAVPGIEQVDFDATPADAVLARFETLSPGDLVILVQTENFRLNEFRLRIELFKRGLKTIEHHHLIRQTPEQYQTFVDALAYDAAYFRNTGAALRDRLKDAKSITVESPAGVLTFAGPFEEPKLNVGDYTGMENVGGMYPIGEVFTECVDLSRAQGEVTLFAFADREFQVQMPTPFSVTIREGLLEAGEDAPAAFHDLLAMIREAEPVRVREIGFGLNRAMRKGRWVNDIGTFERQCGLHLSLGEKHAVYKKPGLNPKNTRYHVDVFVDVTRMLIDDEVVYQDGRYTVPAAARTGA